jgi:hypothetical protein
MSEKLNDSRSLRTFVDSISVTSYGFLKFLSVDNLGEFMDYLTSNDHRTVKAYLSNLGFTSIGHSLYGTSFDGLTVSEEQSYNYLYNPNYVFQIENVIIKPISPTNCENLKFEFILAMAEDYLDSASYSNLSNGFYESSTMNKFATGLNSNIDLLDYMYETPTGYEDEEPNSCPTTTEVEESIAAGRRFWGHNHLPMCTPYSVLNAETGQYETTYMYCEKDDYFVFWIRVRKNNCYGLNPGASCPPPSGS